MVQYSPIYFNIAQYTSLLLTCIYIQGVHLNVLKVICLWESLKIKNMSWKGCFLFPETGPFWYLVSNKLHSYSVIIHLWWFWRLIYVQICKIHWKFMILRSQDSNWPPYRMSWRSELPLRRYLQNNINFLNTYLFNAFSIFSQFHNFFYFGHISVKCCSNSMILDIFQ